MERPNTRRSNAMQHPGVADNPRPRRTSEQVKVDKAKEEKKKEKLAATALKNLERIKELEERLQAKEDFDKKHASNPPKTHRRKVTREEALIDHEAAGSRDRAKDGFSIHDFDIIRDSSPVVSYTYKFTGPTLISSCLGDPGRSRNPAYE